VSGGIHRRSSIAVLGAGISGLTLAAELKERGFTRVVVYEREPRVGGKSCTVSIGGRPHDLGATMGVPIDYRHVLRRSRRAGIRDVPFPRETSWSLARGGPVRLNPLRELPGILAEGAKYLLLHGLRWRGVDGTGLHRAPPALRVPWSQVVERHGLQAVNRRMLAYRTGYGYGYDDTVPAVMYANLFRPRTILGLAVSRSFMWEGGTQPIWEAVARDLDVRTGTAVERLERDATGVVVHTAAGGARFDAVVVTLSPPDALRVLDATEEERGLFSPVRTYPYATYACEVEGLCAGEASVGYVDENMGPGREGHPMAWVKRYPDQGLFVFHLFAPAALSDEAIAARITEDVGRLGGRFVRLHAARRWSFFPHFTTEFVAAGGLERIEAWQGTRRTYLIGEVLSFASMARVTEHAIAMAARLQRDA
jgi:phytoene dehydrogenase-like protein